MAIIMAFVIISANQAPKPNKFGWPVNSNHQQTMKIIPARINGIAGCSSNLN
jgi:hypothetical protein